MSKEDEPICMGVVKECGYETHHIGLTKLEYFAGVAMLGLLSGNSSYSIAEAAERNGLFATGMVAAGAVEHAKALLAELEKEQSK